MKKVLIITYYWPPAGGPGVQRWLKFVKYLKDFGVDPVVFIPEDPEYPIIDTSFLKEVPADVKIIKQPIFEPYKLASLFSRNKTKTISKGIISSENQSIAEKILLWLRGNLFVPDARKFWVRPSVRFLQNYLKQEPIDTIITTGPPHSVHLIGMYLKERLSVRWIADFRDPWTTIGYHNKLKLTKYVASLHKKMEQKVLQNADQILVTGKNTETLFRKITNTPIEVITNGFDATDVPQTEPDEAFTMAHIGSLLSGRNPTVLWESLMELVSEDESFAQKFKLKLAGAVSDEVLNSIKSYGLNAYLDLAGYVSHEQALRLQRSSQVLLLIEIDSRETEVIIPGKLFEYMAAERPILAIGPKDWDVQNIIEETKTGYIFGYSDKDKIKRAIRELYKKYQQGSLKTESIGLERYSRRYLTEKLASLLKS